MSSYSEIQWVVQRNLTNPSDVAALHQACEKLGITFVDIDIIPFTQALPAFDKRRRSIIYGSTTFNALAANDPDLRRGVFFDDIAFSIENYFNHWGAHMLNFGAKILTLRQLIESQDIPGDKLLFIRPDDDNKSFAGEIKRFDEIRNWFESLLQIENSRLHPDSKIVVSAPYNIQYEWRLWIVNKQIVAASKYRTLFKLTKEEGCPSEVIAFATARCQEYTPHDVFVMDICLCGDAYFIVECGCINGTGFYHGNIENIVRAVSDYFTGAG